MPAASMTDGLDVLVQEVMAAMTTWPCLAGSAVGDPPGAVGPDWASSTLAGLPSFFLTCRLGRASKNDFLAAESATRSCGRDGPASDGSTVPRSSSSVSLNAGSED